MVIYMYFWITQAQNIVNKKNISNLLTGKSVSTILADSKHKSRFIIQRIIEHIIK